MNTSGKGFVPREEASVFIDVIGMPLTHLSMADWRRRPFPTGISATSIRAARDGFGSVGVKVLGPTMTRISAGSPISV